MKALWQGPSSPLSAVILEVWSVPPRHSGSGVTPAWPSNELRFEADWLFLGTQFPPWYNRDDFRACLMRCCKLTETSSSSSLADTHQSEQVLHGAGHCFNERNIEVPLLKCLYLLLSVIIFKFYFCLWYTCQMLYNGFWEQRPDSRTVHLTQLFGMKAS